MDEAAEQPQSRAAVGAWEASAETLESSVLGTSRQALPLERPWMPLIPLLGGGSSGRGGGFGGGSRPEDRDPASRAGKHIATWLLLYPYCLRTYYAHWESPFLECKFCEGKDFPWFSYIPNT